MLLPSEIQAYRDAFTKLRATSQGFAETYEEGQFEEWFNDHVKQGTILHFAVTSPHIVPGMSLKPTTARAVVRTNFVQEVEIELTETMTREELCDALMEKAMARFHKAEPETFVTEIEIS